MAEQQSPYIPLSGGLYEGPAISMPVGYWTDGRNMRIERDGVVKRREGLEVFESTTLGLSEMSYTEAELLKYPVDSYEWRCIAKEGEVTEYVAIHSNGIIRFLTKEGLQEGTSFVDLNMRTIDKRGYKTHLSYLASLSQDLIDAGYSAVFYPITSFDNLSTGSVFRLSNSVDDGVTYSPARILTKVSADVVFDPFTENFAKYSDILAEYPLTREYGITASTDGITWTDLADIASFMQYAFVSQNTSYESVAFATIKGNLVVTGRYVNPLYIYKEDNFFFIKKVNIKIRDFEGVDDGLRVDEFPTALEDKHLYNLRNQGWTNEFIQEYFSDKSTYPANNQMYHLGKRVNPSTGVESFVSEHLFSQDFGSTPAPKGRVIYSVFESPTEEIGEGAVVEATTVIPTSIVAFGREFVDVTIPVDLEIETGEIVDLTFDSPLEIQWFTLDGSLVLTVFGEQTLTGPYPAICQSTFKYRVAIPQPIPGMGDLLVNYWYSGTVTLAEETFFSGGALRNKFEYEAPASYPTTICSFSGRIFYAGVQVSKYGLNNKVFFSQLADSEDKLGKCYQDADPTSEHISDLIATDGGVIPIADMGECYGLITRGYGVLLIASNGVWSISGGDDGFSAVSYRVSKISDIGCISKRSILNIKDQIFYASADGIYVIGNDAEGRMSVTDITESRVKNRYKALPIASRRNLSSYYDEQNEEVLFMYAESADTLLLNSGRANKGFVLSLVKPSFSFYEFPDGKYVSTVATFNRGDNEEAIFVSLLFASEVTGTLLAFPSLYFSRYRTERDRFDDFFIVGELNGNFLTSEEVSSYIRTSNNTFGDVQRDKTLRFLTMYFNVTENIFDRLTSSVVSYSSCLTRPSWKLEKRDSEDTTGSFQTYRRKEVDFY